MSTTQITLGLPGFKPEEEPTKPHRIETRHYDSTGRRLQDPKLDGTILTGRDARGFRREIARSVDYNPDGTMHKCNSSCQHARGAECECSCGGRNHGRKLVLTGEILFTKLNPQPHAA